MFEINGVHWELHIVPLDSPDLRRSDGSRTYGVTDRETQIICIAYNLIPSFQWKVICHEIVHAAMYSYNIFLSVEQEEVVADLIATYGKEIIETADSIFYRLNRRAA